jgi:hypothetical protein
MGFSILISLSLWIGNVVGERSGVVGECFKVGLLLSIGIHNCGISIYY